MREESAMMRGMTDGLANAQAEEIVRIRAENRRLQTLLTMCAELVREEANTHDDDCDCDYCEAVAALEQKT